ncbi:MAG: sterol desaturase [Elusimicrobia bacterium CG1_02_63_36]|nr:MAG: sterol desaturase [Elusimicrobia bacterium CG1_02_63_36]PJA18275.1 MAG: sterol desaturase family protein [Elusimicrobia bacterium CG_4_10_14_0_2_um_filter_63_34]PJB23416.1 MAG: sterol desaturase family protein [Elusimicrobia bacterium CG_4_9_14_3_um_filter_62_55]
MEATPWLPAAAAAFLFAAERLSPLRVRTRRSMPRLLVNGAVSLLTLLVAFTLVSPSTHAAMAWDCTHRFGLIPLVGLTGPAELAAGFLLMDLSFYYWHTANHRVPLLWRFHNIHHADPDLDLSTGFRFHPGEVAISAFFRVLQVAALGITPRVYLAYEFVFQLATFFHHSNLRLPMGVERVLNWAIVTPRMHGIHHSNYRDEADSNYSVVFSVWDRVHGSLRLGVPQDAVIIGVPAYAKGKDNALLELLAIPFKRQRDYWRTPTGERLSRE